MLENEKKFEIVLIEDNEADVNLMQHFIKQEITKPYHITVINNGNLAMEFKSAIGTQSLMPDLILLDLNLPYHSGFDILNAFKNDASLSKIPIIIFTTSNNPNDINSAYTHHANSYIIKPFDIKKYQRIFKAIDQFWLNTACPPEYYTA